MRMTELSFAADLPIPTVKYYLREGLVHPGTFVAVNQSDYDESHVHRLKLIRVLVEVGGLNLEAVRAVLAAMDDQESSANDLLTGTHHAVGPHNNSWISPKLRATIDEVRTWIADKEWSVDVDAPAFRVLAEAVVAMRELTPYEDLSVLDDYVDAADRLAEAEVASLTLDRKARADSVEELVLTSVVYGAAFDALRMLASEHHTRVRLGARKITPRPPKPRKSSLAR